MGDGALNVKIGYSTNHLYTATEWCTNDNCDWEKKFDSFYDDKLNNLYLQFEVSGLAAVAEATALDAEDRCLVCMNVDENSELRDGDTGFAACYNTHKGGLFVTTGAKIAMDATKTAWTFMGTVKAINGGTAVKAAKKNGWKTAAFTWNKHKDGAAKCDPVAANWPTDHSGDLYYMYTYHDSFYSSTIDYIGIASEKGFKNTGLNNGENHLKCWVQGSYTAGGTKFPD